MKFARNLDSHKFVKHGGLYSVENPNLALVDFSSNINPFGCPPSVRSLLNSWANKIPIYPDHESNLLKKKIAEYLGTESQNVVVGNGAIEIIYNFCSLAIGNKTPVLIPIPTFGEYEAASKLCKAKPRFFKTMNLEDDLDEFLKQIPKNGVIFICNPNNPTGMMISKKSLIDIIKSAKLKNCHVFVDECFIELTQTPQQSVIDQTKKYDNLFVLRSLTKSFGLAGLRIGYGVGNRILVSLLEKIKIPWSVNGLAQESALISLSERKFLSKTRKLIKKESVFLKNSISKFGGFYCFETSTNFIMMKTKMNSKLLQKKLLQKKILIRDCSSFRGLDNHYVRIAIKTHKENQRLVKALATIT